MHCYNNISDEFGFNPKFDRDKIFNSLIVLKERIENSLLNDNKD